MSENKKFYKNKKNKKADNYKPPFPEEVLSEPIKNLSLREETLALLSGANVNTIEDILKRTETDFYKICHFNKKNLLDVKFAVKKRNLFLKPLPVADAQTEKPSENVQNVTQKKDVKSNEQHSNKQNKRTNERPSAVEQNSDSATSPSQSRKNNRNKPGVNTNNKKQDGAQQSDKHEKKKQHDEPKFVFTTIPEKPPLPEKVVIQEEHDRYVKINKGGLWGFRDRQTKEMTVPAVYDEVFNFKEDLCCVQKDEKFGFINREGEEVIPIMYDCATSFSEGYACVFKGDLCGYINTSNETVIDFKFNAGTPVINGECRVKRDAKWGELHINNPTEIRWII